MSKIVLYTSEDGQTRLDLRIEGETIWLSQLEIAELFQTSSENILMHLKNIYEEGEVDQISTTKDFLVVRQEGKRQVQRNIKHYNLDAILSIGYRVRSLRGIQFRHWATEHLKEYLVKGFVMDDERLKSPGSWDYFDELLERIREIRASEKRFYQKVRELFALSSDYQVREQETQLFFAQAQNKLLYAATGNTAAEIIVNRADASQPNMALTAWKGSRVRKQDVIIAKNYLSKDEIDTLNRLVVIFLEQAEFRVKQQSDLTLEFWKRNIDRMLEFNDQAVLQGAGSVSHDDMKRIAHERYENFDKKRRIQEVVDADALDLQELEKLGQNLKDKRPQ